MAKASKEDQPKELNQRVLTFFKDAGAYGLVEIEISKEILIKHGKIVSKSEPDVFAIFIGNLTKKARDLFAI